MRGCVDSGSLRTLASHCCIRGSCVRDAGEDGDPFDRADPFEGSVPGADDVAFDPVLPFAAKPFETPAPISATVARAASDRSFLLMFHSFVW
jgi:hypothetical protein